MLKFRTFHLGKYVNECLIYSFSNYRFIPFGLKVKMLDAQALADASLSAPVGGTIRSKVGRYCITANHQYN